MNIEKDIRIRLESIVKPEFVDTWLNASNPAFNGKKPIELIHENNTDPIYRMLYVLESGEPLS